MRYIFAILCLIVTAHSAIRASTDIKDSLVRELSLTNDVVHKTKILRDLADITVRTPEQYTYLLQIYNTANNQSEDIYNVLTDLSLAYIDAEDMDSAKMYMNILCDIVPKEEYEYRESYLSMSIFSLELSTDSGSDAITTKLNNIKTTNISSISSIYNQIEYRYIIASALLAQENSADALPYAEQAYELTKNFKSQREHNYKVSVMRLLSRIYTLDKKHDKAIALGEELIAMEEEYVAKFIKPQRPYYTLQEFYIRAYSSLMESVKYMSKEKADRYLDMIMNLSIGSNIPSDKYRCFFAMNNYYLSRNDMQMALSTNDSLIRYATIIAPHNIPELYEVNSIIYQQTGKYEKALKALRTSIKIKDSLNLKNTSRQLNRLQVEYEVNQLNFEKTKLQNQNRQVQVIGLLIVLVLFASISMYLYYNLRKEQRHKLELKLLNAKADESDKLKTAFLNSICHELRTPMNAVVGFSSLMTDPSFEDADTETRNEFANEIQRNTQHLISLVDSMIEVSTLDASDEKLPCQPTDISEICYSQMQSLLYKSRKPEIEYDLRLPSKPVIVPAHAVYFGVVIEHLLDNANKFTESGRITLSCKKGLSCAKIIVTDTGCGIPIDMQNDVFNRFVKIDSFKQGNGLGLYLCMKIITRLHGKVYVDPTYNGGTRMVVELPLE